MFILHIDSEVVRDIGRQLKQTAVSLQVTSQTLNSAAYSLSDAWQSYGRDQFLSEFQSLNQRLAQLADEGMILSQRLQREVNEWERVASQFGEGGVSWQTPLPITAGGGQNRWLPSMPDFQMALPPLSVVSLLGGWSAQWPDWLKERLNPFLPFLQPPPPPTPTPAPSGQTRLGELLDDTPAPEAETEQVSPPPLAAPVEQPVVQPVSPDTGYAVPIKSQGTLGGSAACAPTSVSMILDYYHNLDEQNKTATPQELLTMLDKGDFTHGKGMSLNQITDEMQDLGYNNVTAQANASLTDLQSQLQQGPVIATVRLDMKSGQLTAVGSVVHAVVVKGLSADGQTVFINDPWSGSEMRLPLADFSATWQGGSKGLYVIRP